MGAAGSVCAKPAIIAIIESIVDFIKLPPVLPAIPLPGSGYERIAGAVSIAGGFERFYNFLANMGLVLRDDPPRVIDMTGREWGESAGGLELSVREIPREDSRQQAVLSTVIR